MTGPVQTELDEGVEISLKALDLLQGFSARWKKWEPAALAVNTRQNAAREFYPACDEAFEASKVRTDAVSSLARLQAGFGFKEKEQLAALKQVGLTVKTPAELAQAREDLTYAMKNPLLAMNRSNFKTELDRIPPTVLHKYEEFLRDGRYDKVAKLLEKAAPSGLSRAFSSRQTIEEKVFQLNALHEYAQNHRQWREQHKVVEKYAQEAEGNIAAAVYRTLKSSAWKKLAAEGPDGILFQKLQASNNPAAKVLLDLASADLRRSWYGTATPAIKEIKAALSRLPESVDLRDMTALFRDIERDSRRETEQARALRKQAGLERRDANIRARELDGLLKKDLYGIVGGRRVNLAEQLEKLVENPSAFDAKTRDEILRAAEKAQRSWRDTPVQAFGRSLRSAVAHGIVPDTARVLSRAAEAVFAPVGAAARVTAAHVPDKEGLTRAFNTAASWTKDATQHAIRVVNSLLDKIPSAPFQGDRAFNLA